MLNIYQWFYSNIWPLKNKSYLLNYKDGKVLVKAPIWTWKSFLFFDAPIYALYKSSERTIINKDSKKWEIQLLFSVNDNYFLVVRKLKLTNAGSDSAKTYLYSVLKDKNLIDYLENYKKEDIVLKNNDILTLLNFYQVKLEDLTSEFKQEKEIQEHLNLLLPPKEVALSTIFLPQSSENIFELTPSARINILKKVFGIMWIDEAKKLIDEKKKELYGMIKAKEDTSSYKEKFEKLFSSILEIRKNIENYSFWELDEFIKNKDEIGEDLFDINLDKISILNVDFDSILLTNKNKKEEILKKKEQYKNIEKQIVEKEKEWEQIQAKLKNIEKEISLTNELEKKQKWLKIEIKSQKLKIEKILEKQKEILWKYENLQSEYEKYLLKKNNLQSIEKDYKSLQNEENDIKNNLQKLENEEKKLKQEDLSALESQINILKKELEAYKKVDFSKFTFNNEKVNSLSELDKLISNIENNGKNLNKQIEKIEKDLSSINQELENLQKEQKKWEKTISFNCRIINKDCPLIKDISDKILWKNDFIKEQLEKKQKQKIELEQELEKLKQEKQYLRDYRKKNNISKVRKKIKEFEEKEQQYNNLVLELQKKQKESQKISQIKWKKEELQKQIENIKNKLETTKQKLTSLQQEVSQNVGVEEDYKKFQIINKELEKEQKALLELNNELEKLDDKEDIIKSLQGEKKQLEKQLLKIGDDILKLKKELKNLEVDEKSIVFYENEEKNILELKEKVGKLNDLITDYNKNKLSLIELKNKYSLYKNLSNIFWKELIIYVFMDYLANLEWLINYFIQDIVNFKLNIKLNEKGEELDIFIEDEKWKRDVKSLSGGQKTALRIGWILGISSLQNSKLLFLDETINNFDQESIHIISQKIKEFVEENDMKFYMITHSEILQQSSIWTDIVELKFSK